VNCVGTILELPAADVAFNELFTARPESPASASQPGDTAGIVAGLGAAAADFSACYARELSGLVWFVMSLGADAHRAADVAQSAFAEAFVAWDRIQHPSAWLRRVAGRLHYRYLVSQETSVEDVPDRQGPLAADSVVELHDEARCVLAALADLPPKQRQVMAWTIDGFSPAEIARELDVDPAAIRQSLAKARKHLKQQLGISEPGGGISRAGSKRSDMVAR
jgi:RNA polymerase sigma-70 factor (ECF subfamily)